MPDSLRAFFTPSYPAQSSEHFVSTHRASLGCKKLHVQTFDSNLVNGCLLTHALVSSSGGQRKSYWMLIRPSRWAPTILTWRKLCSKVTQPSCLGVTRPRCWRFVLSAYQKCPCFDLTQLKRNSSDTHAHSLSLSGSLSITHTLTHTHSCSRSSCYMKQRSSKKRWKHALQSVAIPDTAALCEESKIRCGFHASPTVGFALSVPP